MAYLFEFLSDFFQYVYSIDFLCFMFSSVEYALLFFALVFIFMPGMLYVTHSYKPKDFLGYVSVALFWCVCGFLVILSPISLLLYFLYRQLYMLYKKRKESRNSVQVKTTPPTSIPPSPVTPPVKPAARSIMPPQNASPSYRVCHFIWTRSIIFCEHMQNNPTLKCEVYVWTAFFYSITKHMRNQNLVDEIYVQFKPTAELFIKDGENKAMSLHYIQSTYWQFRSTLNNSGIDPRTQDGISKLWELTAQWAFPNVLLPKGAETSFGYNVQLLVNHALTLYGLKPPPETVYYMEAANDMNVRVPESKLDAWQKAQEGQGPKPTEAQKRMIKDRIIREIYGSRPENK